MEQLTIVNNEVRVKEYSGQRVVTFKDVDAVHERPDGTARKRFNDNREHFIEGEDYFEVTQASEIRTLGIERPQGGTPDKVILLTESGYLMLVKSFTDDLAWQVQRVLVNTYFRVNGKTAKPARVRSKPEDVIFRQRLRMADAFSKATGVEIGIAHAVAITETERLTGADYTAWKKILPMRAETRPIPSLNATEVGKLVGLGAQAVNKRLEELGLQAKVGKDWQITEAGKEYGGAQPYNKNGHTGNQVLWLDIVAEALKGGTLEDKGVTL